MSARRVPQHEAAFDTYVERNTTNTEVGEFKATTARFTPGVGNILVEIHPRLSRRYRNKASSERSPSNQNACHQGRRGRCLEGAGLRFSENSPATWRIDSTISGVGLPEGESRHRPRFCRMARPGGEFSTRRTRWQFRSRESEPLRTSNTDLVLP